MSLHDMSTFNLTGTLESMPIRFISAGVTAYEYSSAPYRRVDEAYELAYVKCGRGKAWLDAHCYDMESGYMIACQPGMLLKLRWENIDDRPTIFYVRFQILFDMDRQLRRVLPWIDPVFQTGALADRFAQLFSTMVYEYNNQSVDCQSICNCLLDNVLLLTGRLSASNENNKRRPLNGEIGSMARIYIEQNFANKLTLQPIADALFVNPSHLSHGFRKAQGIAPIQYLNITRIKRAKAYLRMSSSSIQEVAQKVGLDHIPSFNRLFKQVTGMVPTQYRKCKPHELEPEGDLFTDA